MEFSRAVILDMDGLLLDTERISRRAFRMGARAMGLAMTDAQFAAIVGLRVADIPAALRAAFGDATLPAEALMRIADAEYARLIESEPIPLRPYARAFLEYLRQTGAGVAVATSTHTDRARFKLARAGISELTPRVVGGETVARGKPHPDLYLKASALLGAAPEGVLVFEDSPTGVYGAAAAGMRPVLVPDIAPPTERARRLAYASFADLGEALAALAVGRI